MITRRWTGLADAERDRHAHRLVGVPYVAARIAQPDGAGCYRRLIEAALGGDGYAFAWLASSHKPACLGRGRDLFDLDPSEWGAVCLESLDEALRNADLDAGRWLRRQVHRDLGRRIWHRIRVHPLVGGREQIVDPVVLDRLLDNPSVLSHALQAQLGDVASQGRVGVDPTALACGASAGALADDLEERAALRAALAQAMAKLDAPTREALEALADGRPVTAVANRHEMTHAALWQRVRRARIAVQPQLAAYRQTVA